MQSRLEHVHDQIPNRLTGLAVTRSSFSPIEAPICHRHRVFKDPGTTS